jgi:hypothetical protein
MLREELVADIYQLAMNRSLMNQVFTLGRTQGVIAGYQNDNWNFRASTNDGGNALNTDYTSPLEADYAFTGRIEYKGAGEWKQFDDFSGWQSQGSAWLLGGAINYQHSGDTNASAAVQQAGALLYSVDASYEASGWTIFGEFVGRNQDPDSVSDSFNDFGTLVQAGYFFSDSLEGYARWDAVFADGDRTNTDNNAFNTLSFGANYYMFPRSHAGVFTVELDWYLDPTTKNSLVNSVANGGSADLIDILPSNRDDQFALKFQFQFVF